MRRRNRAEPRPDVIVRRNFRHAGQSMAIGGLASLFERALAGQEPLRLHEKQRKRRQVEGLIMQGNCISKEREEFDEIILIPGGFFEFSA
jgi:hypothetical protein